MSEWKWCGCHVTWMCRCNQYAEGMTVPDCIDVTAALNARDGDSDGG